MNNVLTGQTFGNYFFKELIGSGGMGDVYAGKDLSLQRKVAIKVLKPELLDQQELIERFRSEAITLAQLNHPNVATIFAFIEGKHHFLVIEFISGWTLSTLIDKCNGLPIPVSLFIFKQILAGVSAVHNKGIVHRDLKPSNIMITDEMIVKVMDFGLARFHVANRLTIHGKLIGTIEYMSPEQIRGEHTDQLSDIYSLGILLFEMITGRTPFSSHSDYGLMKSQIETPPPSPLKYKNNVPEALVIIITKALSKVPTDRYQSTSEFITVIDNCLIDIISAEMELKELINRYHLSACKVSENSTIDRQFEDSAKSLQQQVSIVEINQSKNLFYNKINLFFAKRIWLGPLILLFSLATLIVIIYLTNSVPEKQVVKTQPDIKKQIPGTESAIRNGQREFLQPYSGLAPSMTNTPPDKTNENIEGEKQAMKPRRNDPKDDISIVIPEPTLPLYERYTPAPNKQSFKNKTTEKVIKKEQPTRSVHKGKSENNNNRKHADEWTIRRE